MATTLGQPELDEFRSFKPGDKFPSFKAGDEKAGETLPESPAVNPLFLSHGTLGCIDIDESQKFYTEFLGLDCVRHRPYGLLVRKGGSWVVVCLEVGERTASLKNYNHWGVDVATPEEVDAAHAAAHKYKDKYGIRRINKVYVQHGNYGFKLQDRDGNWWEVQCVNMPLKYDDRFRKGHVPRGTRKDRPEGTRRI